MAINWLIALKAVPWSDLAQAAPGIVKGARKLYTTVRGDSRAASGLEASGGSAAIGVDVRVTQLENRLATVMAEQQATAEVLRSLAYQNAQLIEAVGIMRMRARVLLVLCALTSVSCAVLAIWIGLR